MNLKGCVQRRRPVSFGRPPLRGGRPRGGAHFQASRWAGGDAQGEDEVRWTIAGFPLYKYDESKNKVMFQNAWLLFKNLNCLKKKRLLKRILFKTYFHFLKNI